MHDASTKIFWSNGSDKHQRQQPHDTQPHHHKTGQPIGHPLNPQWRGPTTEGIPHLSALENIHKVQD